MFKKNRSNYAEFELVSKNLQAQEQKVESLDNIERDISLAIQRLCEKLCEKKDPQLDDELMIVINSLSKELIIFQEKRKLESERQLWLSSRLDRIS